MKKTISILLIFLLGISTTLCTFAADNKALNTAVETAQNIVMEIGNAEMIVDGKNMAIDPDNIQTAPIVIDDRTFIPIRAFVEAIGGIVAWDNNTQTATLISVENEIRLTIGSTTAYLNNNAHTLDVGPVIINNRVMLPIRFIAENFGYTVDWEESTQIITIHKAVTTISSTPFDIEKGTVTLNNGIEMPILGIGTFMLSPEQAEESVYHALLDGYRLIDTANIYMNEKAVGRAIKRSGVPREEIFVTTKLWVSVYDDAANAIDETLERLDLDYIDLLLLHQPYGDYIEAYKAMEKAVSEGEVKSIGLSNFYEDKFDEIMSIATITPAVLQNETNPYFHQVEMREYMKQYGTVLEAWFPLGGRGNTQTLFNDETIMEIAKTHNKSSAQIILRWHLQAGNIAIPGSSNPDHIQENFDIFDFELTNEEMQKLNALDKGRGFYNTSDEEAESSFTSYSPNFNDQE